jgi:transposase-like protein
MATLERLVQERKERNNRYFSEEFKRQKVRELEKNLVNIAELCREYQVSRTSVYKWLYKYSKMIKKGEKQVVERKSDTRKIQELRERIEELERAVGQKQMIIDFKDKMIELAEETYGIDIKKKLKSKLSSGSGSTATDTLGK